MRRATCSILLALLAAAVVAGLAANLEAKQVLTEGRLEETTAAGLDVPADNDLASPTDISPNSPLILTNVVGESQLTGDRTIALAGLGVLTPDQEDRITQRGGVGGSEDGESMDDLVRKVLESNLFLKRKILQGPENDPSGDLVRTNASTAIAQRTAKPNSWDISLFGLVRRSTGGFNYCRSISGGCSW